MAVNKTDIQIEKLKNLCREYNVEKLYLFGSVAAGSSKDGSDIDFLVEFKRRSYDGAFDQFMDFKKRLEEVYQQPVDLLVNKKFRNPAFNEEIEKSKVLVYAALYSKTAY